MTEKSSDKYFYISVPREEFHEAKHHFYNAPSSYLKVYELDYIQLLEQQNKQLIEALEEIKDEEWRLAGEFTTIYTTAYHALQQKQGKDEEL